MSLEPAADPRPSGPTLSDDNPWPGLAAFGEQDRAYFFGREQEAAELHRLVMRERLTVLFGLSGLGKSSLLQAGLFPLVRLADVLPVYIRLDFTPAAPDFFAQITNAMVAAAAAADIEAPPVGQSTTLWEYFHRREADFWSRRNRPMMPLLVFDQFEEIFTLARTDPARSAASETLIEQLSDLAEGRPPAAVKAWLDAHPSDAAAFTFGRHHYKILLTIREDFLAELEGLRGRLSAVALNRYRLRRMNGSAALLVVHQAPHLIDAEVAEQVVRFVGAGRPGVALSALDVEPALLSVVCHELNEKRRRLGESKISPRLLEGSQEDVLSGFYESSVEDLPPGARSFIEERLLTVSGYRDSVALENALGMPGVTRPVVDRLVERRLVRIEDRAGVQRLELTHDLLTGVVRASRDRRRAAEAAQQERLARQDAQEREQRAVGQLRRTRRIGVAFLVLAIIAVAASVLSFLAQREAARQERSAREAVSRFAVQDAERHLQTGRRDLALAHLAYAVRSDPDSVTARGWLTDLLRRPWWLPGEAVRHGMQIVAASVSASGTRLVALSDLTVRVLDAELGKAVGEPVRVTGAPTVSFVDGGRRVVVATNRDVSLLDAVTGRQVARFTTDGTIVAVREGRHVLTYTSTLAFAGGQLRLWDLESGKPIGHIDEELIVNDLSRDGRRVLTWSNRERVTQVWDAITGTRLGEPINPGDIIGDTAKLSPDGRRVITAFRPDKARIWDAETGKPVGEELDPGAFVGFVSFSPDSRLALTASRVNGSVRVWEVETGKNACIEELPPMQVGSVHWSSDGRRLLIGSGAEARVWDMQRCVPIGEPLRHDGGVATISADGRRVLTASDKTAQIWDEYNRTPPSAEPGAYGRPVGFRPDGRRVLMVSQPGRDSIESQLWDVESEAPVGQPLKGVPAGFVADGRRVLLQSFDGSLQVQDAETGGAIGKPFAEDFNSNYATFSRGGRRMLEASPEKAILWDLESGKPVGQPFDGARTGRLFVGPADRVVRVSVDGRIQVWDAQSAKSVGDVVAHKGPARSVEFSLDGRRAVVIAADAPARLLDMATGRPIGDGLLPAGVATFAAFTPDDRLVMIAAADGSVQLVSAEDGKPGGPGFRDPTVIAHAVMSRDGRLVATVGEMNTVRLWDTSSHTPVGESLDGFTDDRCKPSFSRDGRLLLVPSSRTTRIVATESGRAFGEPIPRNGTCAVFDAAGRHVITTSSDAMVEVLEILVAADSPAAINRLADLAEGIAGYRISARGSLEILPDRQQRLDQLRRAPSQPAGGRPVSTSLIRRRTASAFQP